MKRKKNNRRQNQLIIIAILMIVIGTGVAYAALSNTLIAQVNKVTQNAFSFGVIWNAAGSARAGGTSATGRSCGTATVSNDKLTVTVADTMLSKPDDSCDYKLTLKNQGTIPATLTSITATAPSGITCTNNGASMVCGNITYTLASAVTFNSTSNTITSMTALTTGGTALAASATRDIYLVAKYTGNTLNTAQVVQSGAKFTLVYTQS